MIHRTVFIILLALLLVVQVGFRDYYSDGVYVLFDTDEDNNYFNQASLQLKGLSIVTLLITIPFGYLIGWLFCRAIGRRDIEREQFLAQLKLYRKVYMGMEKDVKDHRRARLEARNDLARANSRLQRMERENRKLLHLGKELQPDDIFLLNTKIKQLESELKRKHTELRVVRNERSSKLHDLQEKLKHSEDTNGCLKAKIQELEMALQKWKNEVSDFDGELANLRDEARLLKTEKTSVNLKLQEMEIALHKWKNRAKKRKNENLNINEKNNELENELQRRKEELRYFQEAVNNLNAKVRKMDDELPSLRDEARSNKDEKIRLNSKLSELAAELQIQKDESQLMKDDKADLICKLSEFAAELQMQKDESQLMKDDKANLICKLSELAAELQMQKDDSQLMKDNKADLICKMNQLERKLKETTEQTKLHKDENISIKSKLSQVNQRLCERTQSEGVLRQELASLNMQLAKTKGELTEADEEICKYRTKDCNECDRYRQRYYDLMEEYNDQDKFRKNQLQKVKKQAEFYWNLSNDRQWQNCILRDRLLSTTGSNSDDDT